MEKYVLLVFLSFLWTDSMAQSESDYLPFLEEGKAWVVKNMIRENTGSYTRTFIIKGDTIINDKQYKKLIEENRGLYIYALREEGKKIYSVAAKDKYGSPNTEEYLWYDFNVSKGDIIETERNLLQITETDYIYVNGYKRKRIYIYCTGKTNADYCNGSGIWIEGIGSDYGPTSPNAWALDGGGSTMEECFADGQILFNYDDFTAPAYETALEPQHTDLLQPSYCAYDLQGHRLTGKPGKGLYIQNGKKVMVK